MRLLPLTHELLVASIIGYCRNTGNYIVGRLPAHPAYGPLVLLPETVTEFPKGFDIVKTVAGRPTPFGRQLIHVSNKYYARDIYSGLPDGCRLRRETAQVRRQAHTDTRLSDKDLALIHTQI